ncbi:MAG: CinA family protein [Lachnospiraceae bacterium]|nr:CinA family protein [Lachnospiraceae bacterium]
MAGKMVARLIRRGWHIAFAESCTGGLAAAALVEVPDASRVLDESVVTYANEAKIKYLGVRPETIEAHGVVSEEVAGEMASGIARAAAAQVGVGISGIAGPSGGTEQKPVGTVCFGFWINGRCETRTMQFGNIGRNAVRRKSVEYVYRTLEELTEQD